MERYSYSQAHPGALQMKQLLDEHLMNLPISARRKTARSGTKQPATCSGDRGYRVCCGAPQMMKGESLMNVSTGYDTVQFREPLGVFAGIAPWNFPACFRMGGWLPSASSPETALC